MTAVDVVSTYCKVNVGQFYEIELEDFLCKIAQVGMWLIDHQMNNCVAEHFGVYYTRLPLRASAIIVNENALRIDWNEVVDNKEKKIYSLKNQVSVLLKYLFKIEVTQ